MCCVLVTQLCLTRETPDCSLPGSCVHGILQARILKLVAIYTPIKKKNVYCLPVCIIMFVFMPTNLFLTLSPIKI